MKIIPLLTFIVDLAVDIWLLWIVWRRDVWKQLPWFALYIVSELLATCIGMGLWPTNRRLYVTVFWWTELVRITLVVGAVRESFIRTFVGFSSLRWFPWVVRGVIASVVAYSIAKAVYAPPVHSTRLVAFIIAGEFTIRWGVVAIGLLSLVLIWILDLPMYTRETAVLAGYTIASTAFLVAVMSRSLFGIRFIFITEFVPDIGYLMAATIWIKHMLRPEQAFGFKELGITPEEMALELRRYREIAERIIGKTKISSDK